jgi:hypothetical protein
VSLKRVCVVRSIHATPALRGRVVADSTSPNASGRDDHRDVASCQRLTHVHGWTVTAGIAVMSMMNIDN